MIWAERLEQKEGLKNQNLLFEKDSETPSKVDQEKSGTHNHYKEQKRTKLSVLSLNR